MLTALRVYRALGLRAALRYALSVRMLHTVSGLSGADLGGVPYLLYVPGVSEPVWCRYGTSDREAFVQVFIHQQYAVALCARNPEYIVDCGANVGYTSVYFLSRFPTAFVTAVEPDPGNYQMLTRNLAPYGHRAKTLHAAVWPSPANLMLERPSPGLGLEWATRVRESPSVEMADVPAVEVRDLLDAAPQGRIDILKMDIEGAEREIFAHDCSQWLHRIGMLIIELHGSVCEEVFFRAIEGHSFNISTAGELTVLIPQ